MDEPTAPSLTVVASFQEVVEQRIALSVTREGTRDDTGVSEPVSHARDELVRNGVPPITPGEVTDVGLKERQAAFQERHRRRLSIVILLARPVEGEALDGNGVREALAKPDREVVLVQSAKSGFPHRSPGHREDLMLDPIGVAPSKLPSDRRAAVGVATRKGTEGKNENGFAHTYLSLCRFCSPSTGVGE